MTTNVQPTQAEMLAIIQRLQAENEALRKAKQGKLTLKVSEKGAVSLYGMGRWPVTLYRTQWERLIQEVDQIKAFINVNAHLLAKKEDA